MSDGRASTITMRFDSFSAAARQRLAYERATWRSREDALSLTVNGFCKEVLKQQPMEFAIERRRSFSPLASTVALVCMEQ